jgi:hypothetical protein
VGWLFYGKQIDALIELGAVDEAGTSRRLTIRLVEPSQTVLTPAGNGGASSAESTGSLTTALGARELLVEYKDSEGQTAVSRALIAQGGDGPEIKVERARLAPAPAGILLSTHYRSTKEDAERFSQLARSKRQAELLATLCILDSRLNHLEVLVTGGVPMINGDLGIGELVPVPFMGEGFVRLLSILLAIAVTPNGYVLIDEIENGLHHSTLTAAWTAIADAARRSNVQIFATTHSWECIRAAHEAFAAASCSDLRLLRLDEVKGEIREVAYDAETLETALATGLEVR